MARHRLSLTLCGVMLAGCGRDDAPTVAPSAGTPRPPQAGTAHADHASKHGGQLIMAGDYHVEGTLPDARTFRLWVYDKFTRPLPVSGATGTARITVRPRQERRPPEYTTVPMKPGDEGSSLVAELPAGLALPIEVRAIVSFPEEAPRTFDFPFREWSLEPAPSGDADHGPEHLHHRGDRGPPR